ncbi:MAG TPA: TIGR01777 family oxidoreductase [Terriglobia bacterium]|nr:TIGR01777 family oxidoreductase [Terriglobia bacterium]
MKVLMTGASGFIGAHLTRHLEAAGHQVFPVSRTAGKGGYDWSDASLRKGVEDTDAVIHLAGENLFGRRWTAKQKAVLWSSRHDTTTRLAALVAARRPSCFMTASAVGYYGASDDTTFHEGSPPGKGFLADLCVDWEASTAAAVNAGVRSVIVRTGVVLGKGGGALAQMLTPFKLGLGGPLGSGRQWVSWIHIDDLTALYTFLLEAPHAVGPYNGTAPNPVTMTEFATALGQALHRPAVLPVPGIALRLALGEVADVLLTGQRVRPRRALESGFTFRFPEIGEAFRNIVG